ncbi:hypothetical protein [Pseudonocardia sp. N23]|uniref:hypothetical protein n=1 Tax=Pseudonocardia sp. N23 TaxID=1987376 RepID=UPI000BFC2C1C|nr:hypothetical protein [Pseudonocardia sp. N23]
MSANTRLREKVSRLLRERAPGWTWRDLNVALRAAGVRLGWLDEAIAGRTETRDGDALEALAGLFRVPVQYLDDDDFELRVLRFCGPCRVGEVGTSDLEAILVPLARAVARHSQ